MNSYEKLFSPMQIGKIAIKNRTVMTAMGVDVSDCDGKVNDMTIAYYEERAKGGVGLIITEYCRVNESDGACATGQISLSRDRYIPGIRKLADAVHAHGTKLFIQLHHPGRQSVPVFVSYWPMLERVSRIYPGVWNKFFEKAAAAADIDYNDPANEQAMKEMQKGMKPCLAPSVIPEAEDDGPLRTVKVRAFTGPEIDRLEKQFIAAAERAKKAGADGVELHAGHGYLFQQFLSPYTNRRTDAYGGSLENRCRLLTEIIQGIHANCGTDFPVTVRLSVDEFYEKTGHPERGYHIADGVRMAQVLEKAGADGINVTVAGVNSTNLVTESTRYAPGWRAPYVKQVKDALSIPVIAVGVIRTPEQAEALLQAGVQDFIGLGRPLLADSQWVKKAERGEAESINRCISCLSCMDSFAENMLNDKPILCALNPRTCRETAYRPKGTKNGARRKIVVVGAGPSGLMAARELAYREFNVVVLEKEAACGGQINEADRPVSKERLHWCVEDLERQVKKAGATIKYNTKATKESIGDEAPFAVIIAAGAKASKPPIPGANQTFVHTVTPIIMGEMSFKGKKIVLAGSGMTGLETAEMLADAGNQVTVIEMADKIAQGKTGIDIAELIALLRQKQVRFMTGTKLKEIGDHIVTVEDENGKISSLGADEVVLSLGSKKNDALAADLAGQGCPVYIIGDASKVGRISDATRSAFEIARTLV